MNKRLFALGRLKSGELNKTEQRYKDLLERLKTSGEVLWYIFEGMTFKLADNTRYTPDFMVMRSNGEIQAHEVKGSKFIFQDDAKVKVKVAAEMFPVKFIVVFPNAKTNNWDVVEY